MFVTSQTVSQPTGERQAIDPIELLERAAAAGEDVYEAAVGIGQHEREQNDRSKWNIGDLAKLIEKRYGENRIGQFAKQINVQVDRVQEYRTTCKFWERSVRAEFVAIPTLSYSHLRAAKRLYAKVGMDGVRAFLYQAADNAWSAEQTRIEVNIVLKKPVPPKRLLDAVAWLTSIDRESGRLVIDLERGVDLAALEQLIPDMKFRLVLSEVKDE